MVRVIHKKTKIINSKYNFYKRYQHVINNTYPQLLKRDIIWFLRICKNSNFNTYKSSFILQIQLVLLMTALLLFIRPSN